MDTFVHISELVSHFINAAVEYWPISLLVVALLLVVLAGIKWGIGRAVHLLVIELVIVGVAIFSAFLVMLLNRNVSEFIEFAVAWGPTVLFCYAIFIGALIGIRRGLRKSLILMLHAVVAAAVSIAVYFVCVNSDAVDRGLLDVGNFFMGGSHAVQNSLSVSSSCSSMREVLTEFFINQLGYGAAIDLLLKGSGAYVSALVDMIYRLGLAVVAFVFYELLVFLLYIVYHIFYPERRYRKKKMRAFAAENCPGNYRKHRVGGGIVGFARGLTAGLLSLSFIGSAFFVIAGGTGDATLKDYKFDNAETNFYYSAYRSIESYGSQGIFKVLNMLKDGDDAPYYLFAADLIFSGELDDVENEVSGHVKFREELGAYIGFARDTFSLLMKYGEEELTPLLNGDATEDAMTTVVKVMSGREFQYEFDNLIDDFDEKTYFINLSLSLVKTVATNLDEFGLSDMLSEDNRELLQVLFREGYLSDSIPDERELKQSGTKETEARPYLNLTKAYSKDDVRILLKVMLNFFGEGAQEASSLDSIKAVLPQIKKLSVFAEGKKEIYDPVLGRVYCLLENQHLTREGVDGVTYREIAAANVSWTDEIYALVNVAEDGLELYRRMETDGDLLRGFINVFDAEGADYAENMMRYERLCGCVADSRLLGKVLSSDSVFVALQEQLSGAIEGYYLPEGIVYENRYRADGALSAYGELFKFMNGVKLLCTSGNGVLETLLGGDADLSELLKSLSEIIGEKDGYGITLSEYLSDSVLLRSAVSAAMVSNGGDTLYVPRCTRETSSAGVCVNLIKQGELRKLLDVLPDLVDLLLPYLEEDKSLDDVSELLADETFRKLFEKPSAILEGTVANIILDLSADSEFVIIPKALKDPEAWISGLSKGELRYLLDAIEISGINLAEIANGGEEDSDLLDRFLELDADSIKASLRSRVLYYSVSENLLQNELNYNEFEIIVPKSSRVFVKDDAVSELVSQNELLLLFGEMAEMDLSGELSLSSILTRVARHKEFIGESNILAASIVNFITNNGELRDLLSLPETYLEAGEKSKLLVYNSSNVWYAELPALIDVMDEIFCLSDSEEDVTLTDELIDEKVSAFAAALNQPSAVKEGQIKLDVCYRSKILLNNLTERLDDVFIEKEIVSDEIRESAKDGGYYRYAELQAISGALDCFSQNIQDMESDEFTEQIRTEVLRLNDVRPEPEYHGKTTLDVIYPSVIISYLITDEIDYSSRELVDAQLSKNIKRGKRSYSKYEVFALVNAAAELNVATLDELENYDFGNLKEFARESVTEPGEPRIRVVCRSELIGAILTKEIHKGMETEGSVLRDHPKAYTEVGVYREEEIECLTELIEGNSASDFAIGPVAEIKPYLCGENGETVSYLLAASLSETLYQNNGLKIPSSVIDRYGAVESRELSLLLEAFAMLVGTDEGRIADWDVTPNLVLPLPEQRECVVASTIMRATLTNRILALNGSNIKVNVHHVAVGTDKDHSPLAVIDGEQMLALFAALEICSGGSGGELNVPAFSTIEEVKRYYGRLDELFASDVIRHRICDMLVRNYEELLGEFAEETAYDLNARREVVSRVITVEALKEFLSGES